MKKEFKTAIIFKLIQSFVFAFFSILLVLYSSSLPVVQLLFLRAIIGSMIAFIIIYFVTDAKQRMTLTSKSLLYYMIRVVTNFVALFCWIYALKYLGINEAMALGYLIPVWLMFIAIFFLKERFYIRSIVVIIVNSIAVFIILQPQHEKVSWIGVAALLVSTILWATYDTICKKQTLTEHYLVQSFYSHLFSSVLALPFALYFWQPMSLGELCGSSLIALFGVINVIALFLSYSNAPMILLVPFSYSRLVFSAILAYLFYDEIPELHLFIGAAFIIATELYYYRSNKKLHELSMM